jgi:soluble lytic murein transglycosylase-like protein
VKQGLAIAIAAVVIAGVAQPVGAAQWRSGVEEAARRGDLMRAAQLAAAAATARPADPLPSAWTGIALALAGHVHGARPWLQRAAILAPQGAVGAAARTWLAAVAVPHNRRHDRMLSALALRANPKPHLGQAQWIARAIVYAASAYHIDPLLLGAVVFVESGFNHAAVSPAGAMGLAQLMPATARGTGVDPRAPRQNLIGAARLLRGHLDAFQQFPDPLAAALAAYHAGGAAVRRADGRPPYPSTARYVAMTQTIYLQLLERAG